MEKFTEAFTIADEVVQEYPFVMQARFLRGSVLALIGRELEGLKDLPESSSSSSWREWLRPYYRGLILFKLERYEDAKKILLEELPKAIASREEKDILRMASAICLLNDNETQKADKILSEIFDVGDYHAQYLLLVLKMHSAAQKEDLATVKSLSEQISGLPIVDIRLEKAVKALVVSNFSLAKSYETDALLKLAA